MSEIEWSPWIKGDPEPFARFSDIQVDGQSYRIPMEDYKRITGMPEWGVVPEWGQWLAQDLNGHWYSYDKKPYKEMTAWDVCGGMTYRHTDAPKCVLGNWEDTLQKRPADQLDTHPNSDLDADECSVVADTLQYDPEDVAFTATASSAPDFLRAALSHMEDRKATYDAPQGERSMGKTVAAFNAITGLDLSEEQGWLFMVLLKSVRTQQGGFRADNYEDGAAYFGLQGEAAAKERGSE